LPRKIQDASNNGPDKSQHVCVSANHASATQSGAGVGVGSADPPSQFRSAGRQIKPEWDTIEDIKDIEQFGITLRLILGFIGVLTLAVGPILCW
jgi:hypothetical protein